MFEVGGNTCNNAIQLATQQCCVKVEGKCFPYYRALSLSNEHQARFPTLLSLYCRMNIKQDLKTPKWTGIILVNQELN